MMDRKEQGRLIEILEMEYMETGGIGDTAFEYGRKRNERLEEVRSSCRKHLSGARSACLDELIDAIGASLSKRRLPIFMEMSRELLRCLMEELRREKEIKKEIVFLPVKAAMLSIRSSSRPFSRPSSRASSRQYSRASFSSYQRVTILITSS